MQPAGVVSIGDVVAGRYAVEAVLGQGGMAIVYRARHTTTNRLVALKVILPHLAARPQLTDLFVKEARVGGTIGSSPHIVDVLDAGYDEARRLPFLAMELLEGETLGQVVERHGALGRDVALTLLDQLAEALDQAHERGVVHRDLKPSNLFLTRDRGGRPVLKVVDFGIAKVLEGDAHQTATEIGTPAYAAPEQMGAVFRHMARTSGAAVADQVSPATDLWALGLIAFELMTGARAGQYWGATTASDLGVVMAMALRARPLASTRAGDRAALLPPGFDAWFDRCLQIDPRLRWPTAGQAVAALRACCAGQPVAVAPPPSSVHATSLGGAVHTFAPAMTPAPAPTPAPASRPAPETAFGSGLATFAPTGAAAVPGAAPAFDPARTPAGAEAGEPPRRAWIAPTSAAVHAGFGLLSVIGVAGLVDFRAGGGAMLLIVGVGVLLAIAQAVYAARAAGDGKLPSVVLATGPVLVVLLGIGGVIAARARMVGAIDVPGLDPAQRMTIFAYGSGEITQIAIFAALVGAALASSSAVTVALRAWTRVASPAFGARAVVTLAAGGPTLVAAGLLGSSRGGFAPMVCAWFAAVGLVAMALGAAALVGTSPDREGDRDAASDVASALGLALAAVVLAVLAARGRVVADTFATLGEVALSAGQRQALLADRATELGDAGWLGVVRALPVLVAGAAAIAPNAAVARQVAAGRLAAVAGVVLAVLGLAFVAWGPVGSLLTEFVARRAAAEAESAAAVAARASAEASASAAPSAVPSAPAKCPPGDPLCAAAIAPPPEATATRTGPPDVREEGLTVNGRLPQEVVGRITRQNLYRVRKCYAAGLASKPGLAGTISVRFVIGRDGSVANVANAESAIGDAAVVRCILDSFATLSFPQPEGGMVTVEQRLRLAPPTR